MELIEIAENFDPPEVVYERRSVLPRGIVPDDSIQKNLCVILIKFKGDPALPPSKTDVQAALFSASRNVVAFYEEMSYGATFIKASVFGPFEVDKTTTPCNKWEWIKQAKLQLLASGVDVSQFTNFIGIGPRNSDCTFSGVAYVGGNTSYMNGNTSWATLCHELGHNFGVLHAKATASLSATPTEYGDPFDRMGRGAAPFNATYRYKIKILEDKDVKVVTATSTNSVGALDIENSGVKLLHIARPDGTKIAIDTVRDVGSYNQSYQGVSDEILVRIVDSANRSTTLIDMHPTDSTRWGLATGEEWTDPLSNITIRHNALGVVSSSVRVIIPGTKDEDKMKVFIATGTNYPDALSAAAAVAAEGGRILLTRPGDLPASTKAALLTLKPTEIIIVGGLGVVGASVESALRSYAPSVTRVQGADRYETAANVAKR